MSTQRDFRRAPPAEMAAATADKSASISTSIHSPSLFKHLPQLLVMRRSRDLSPPSPPSDSHIGRRPKACFACRKVKVSSTPPQTPLTLLLRWVNAHTSTSAYPPTLFQGNARAASRAKSRATTASQCRRTRGSSGRRMRYSVCMTWCASFLARSAGADAQVFSLERRTRRSSSPGPSGERSNRDVMTTTREMPEDEVFSFGRNSPSAAALDGRSHRPTPPDPYRITHPSEIYGLNPLPLLGSASSAQMSNDRSQPLQATGEASGRREMGRMGTLGERMLIASAKNAGPLLPDIGSLDPRPSVISKRVLTPSEARSMVT